MVPLNSQLFKQFFVFVIIFPQIFCSITVWNAERKDPTTLQNSLVNSDSRLRRATDYSSKLGPEQLNNFNLCVSKIKDGDFHESVKYYGKLISVPISDVINITYHSESIQDELEIFKNIMDFIIHQPTREEDKLAIQTLYNLIKESNDVYSYKGAMLYSFIDDSPAKDDLSVKYIQLRLKNTYLIKFQERLLNVLLNGVIDDELEEFGRQYYFYYGSMLDEVLLNAIKDKDSLTNNFDNILHFIRRYIGGVESSAIRYSWLYNELDKKHLLSNNKLASKLGREIRRFMTEQSSYKNMNKSTIVQIESICDSLEYCKNEELYKSSAAKSVCNVLTYLSTIFMLTSILLKRF